MRTIVGVMGSGEDGDTALLALAHDLGGAIAREGWVLLNGGRACGVMDASARGASEAGGLVVGVLPDDDTHQASTHLDIPIRTGMGDARNAVNVLSSDVVIALRGDVGTLSEIALALKAKRPVIALAFDPGGAFARYRARGDLRDAASVDEAIALTREALEGQGKR
jgi:uncharacterized protein (TIGR00725 family)